MVLSVSVCTHHIVLMVIYTYSYLNQLFHKDFANTVTVCLSDCIISDITLT